MSTSGSVKGGRVAPSNAYARTLAMQRLGYELYRVESAPIGPFRPESFVNRVWSRMVRPIYRMMVVQEILDGMRGFEPDLAFVEKGIVLDGDVIRRIRRSASRPTFLVHMNPDDPFGRYSGDWRRFLDAIPEYDLHFVPKEENRAEYLRHGAKAVVVFDRSFDPTVHKPVQLSGHELIRFGCEVGFIGACAPHREQVLAHLMRSDIPLAIWGDGWDRGAHWNELRGVWRGGTQIGEAYAKAICGMKIALHFLRRENRDQQDSRTFEIPACGSFMLAERSRDHERLFQDGVEAVYFDTTADLLQKIDHYLTSEDERTRIATAGYRRARSSGYDHDARIAQILADVESVRHITRHVLAGQRSSEGTDAP